MTFALLCPCKRVHIQVKRMRQKQVGKITILQVPLSNFFLQRYSQGNLSLGVAQVTLQTVE